MKWLFLLSKYDETTRSYQPARIFDDFTRMKEYVDDEFGEFSSLAKYPTNRTYTFDYLPSE